MKLKIKKAVAINNLLFMLAILGAWFCLIPTTRYLTTSIEQIDLIKEAFERRLSLTIELQSDSISKYPDLLPVYNSTIKTPLEQENIPLVYSQRLNGDDNSSITLSIKCHEADKQNILEVNSSSDYVFTGDCEQLQTSKKLQREIKRVIFSLTRDIDEDVNLNLAFEVVHINIYLITSVKDTSNLDIIKKRIIDIANPFFNMIELPKNHVRLNFNTLYLEDLSLKFKAENNNTAYVIDFKDLDEFLDTYPSGPRDQIYTFESESINLFIFSHQNLTFEEDGIRYNYFDEKKEKYAALSLSSKKNEYDIQIIKLLYRMFELTTLRELSNTLNAVQLQYQTSLEFGLFNERRERFITKKIVSGLEAFKFMIKDTELIIEKGVGEEIDRQIQRISRLNFDSLEIQDLREIYQIIWTLNYEGNHKYGERDSFSDEYRIGVYLPLLLPFVFPAIKALKRVLRKKRTAAVVVQE